MNIFVGNLNPETSADSLRTLFAEFGEIMSSKVIFDTATGMSRGFGFVEMAILGCSQDAIDNLDISYFEGNIISVKEAKQSTNTRGSQRPSYGSKPYGNKPSYGAKPAYGAKPSYGTSPGGRPFKPRTTTPRPPDNGDAANNGDAGDNFNNPNAEGGYKSNFNRNY